MAKKIKHKTGRPKASSGVLNRQSVIDVSWEIANEIGAKEVSIKLIAERLGIRSPSVYNHVTDLSDIVGELSARAGNLLAENLENVLEEGTRSGLKKKEKIRLLFREYRNFARNHYGVYSLLIAAPVATESHRLAAERILSVCLNAFDSDRLDKKAIHEIRIMRSILHGFVTLEKEKGFGLPESVEETFEILTEGFIAREWL
ncbi:TetR/AcrR family transcriptional regulator [Leptospira idonii]|uniref:TetR/AcrR family transcriptional regulator n=1 Tax=Leptospira idonii TaxID=1193500 RepID=A0A4V3JXM9_9LEPT|nr:TetR/AcrR family transcriptional regulator [Leptospira idonii]TGN17891.1 TetR/AcrR family transcriptional regulator [Leptospira idonii]